MSGADVAATMLRHYGIQDVQVIHVEGQLTDHYNPANKTVNLSQDVYHGRNVAAAAVAAHECGHAVQHATAYSMLQLRSALVPIVNVAASLQQYLFMMALVGMSMFNNQYILLVVLIVFGITCFFSLVTLPVEFDASRRALAWLDTSGVARGEQYDGAKDALFWAAMTYVAAALAALLQFVYLLMKFLGNRE
jgi:Zn-dependent membrane protease YugP